MSDALFLAGVSVALVLFGRVLLALPRPLQRAFGRLGLGAALILHAFGLVTIALVGIGDVGAPHGAWWRAAFALGWLLVSGGVWGLAMRIARAFPRRATRLHLVAGASSADGKNETTPPRVRHRGSGST